MRLNKLLLLGFVILRAVFGTKCLPPTTENSIISQAIIEVVDKSFLDDILIVNVITAPRDEKVKLLTDSITNEIARNLSSVASVKVADVDNLGVTKERRFYNILLISDYATFEKLNRSIELFYFEGYFLIVFVDINEQNRHRDIDKIFRYMWSKYIINVNVVVAAKVSWELEMFTYFPYTPAHCSRTTPVLVNKFANSSFRFAENHFSDKTSNLFRCPLRVVTFNIAPLMFVKEAADGKYDLSGIEGELLKGKT